MVTTAQQGLFDDSMKRTCGPGSFYRELVLKEGINQHLSGKMVLSFDS